MIVDLMRNDLGRIARTGSVSVPELFAIERYPTVWQMTSTVAAALRPELDSVDALTQLFPCGSVTGAPKIRAMQAIGVTEPGPRGAYTRINRVRQPGAARRSMLRSAPWRWPIAQARHSLVLDRGL